MAEGQLKGAYLKISSALLSPFGHFLPMKDNRKKEMPGKVRALANRGNAVKQKVRAAMAVGYRTRVPTM